MSASGDWGKRRSEQSGGKTTNGKGLPKKRFYRARAHSNPLSDCQFSVPISPTEFSWAEHFPAFSADSWEFFNNEADEPSQTVSTVDKKSDVKQKVKFADVGCGFGGLLVKLSVLFPSTLMIGMELRDKVSEFVKERIVALRQQHPDQYQNISVLRTNAMKYLPNYFEKGQLEKMFFLFPDPHFKEKNHRRRIISQALLAEYAYVMAVGGILYTITDVEELGNWMKMCLDEHPLFEEVPAHEQTCDEVVKLLPVATEEGQKVQRNNGRTFLSVYTRIQPR
eukprot:TRINITY_DN3933_c0_g2_i1.p1 TRINITY_DN3933_c0_g2~~TRINITY_DN3933_c0_g2_i1.p1  ORF type:complete len:280 (-),score=41.58 TRINITY_DN3933_c0_g2_i1:185-1024(-)